MPGFALGYSPTLLHLRVPVPFDDGPSAAVGRRLSDPTLFTVLD